MPLLKSVTGRTAAKRSIPFRRSQAREMPVPSGLTTSGRPVAPRKTASASQQASLLASGKSVPVFRKCSAPPSSSVSSTFGPRTFRRAARMTLSPSRITSGPIPSPGSTAILYPFFLPFFPVSRCMSFLRCLAVILFPVHSSRRDLARCDRPAEESPYRHFQ